MNVRRRKSLDRWNLNTTYNMIKAMPDHLMELAPPDPGMTAVDICSGCGTCAAA